jgi:uncharacterized protein with GYD domain
MADINFVLLLKLTDDGRRSVDQAVASLEGMGAVIGDLGGGISSWTMTLGEYDAAAMAHLDSLESVASLASWIASRGFFTSETLIGAEAAAFQAAGKSHGQS